MCLEPLISKKGLDRTSNVAKLKPAPQPYWTFHPAVESSYKSLFDTNFVEPRIRRISVFYDCDLEYLHNIDELDPQISTKVNWY